MSRIHEALKKAEQEGGTSVFAELAEPRDSSAGEAVRRDGETRRADEIDSHLGLEGAPATSRWLRLEELRQRCVKPGWRPNPDYVVFTNKQSFVLCAEQFRTLRSRLYRLQEKRPIRIVLVTSAVPGEGKSFVALNLAFAIARQHERRALLIDADLRASSLHVRMGAPSAPGLTDYLRGEADEFSILQTNEKDNLFFIPAGKLVPNPAELLASNQLKSLLERLGPVFDWIILDAPPLMPVSDASVLAGLCDGALFVVRAASTAYDQAKTACQELQEKNLLGVVLNQAEEEGTYGAYSYYAGTGMGKR